MAPEIPPPSPQGGATRDILAPHDDALPEIVIDAKGHMRRLSGAALRYLQPAEDAIGAKIVPRLRPELRASLETALTRAFATGEPVLAAPRRMPCPEGARRIAVHVRPLRDGAAITGAQLSLLDCGPDDLVRDGTTRADTGFRALPKATAFAVYRMSPDWSEMRILKGKGFLRDTDRPNHRWLDDYLMPEDQPLMQEAIARAVRSRKMFELEHPVKCADGSTGWAFSRAVPILDATGEIVEWIGAASDLTARRRALENLAQARRIEAIGRLAGGISHDFNNLLTVILANLELADMRVTDPGARALIDRAVKAAELGSTFNRRLLSLVSRRGSTRQPVDLRPRIREMAAILERALGERIVSSTDIADDLWPVRADPGEIDSTLLNLALNGRDAMPAGGQLLIAARNLRLDAQAASAIKGGRAGDFVRVTVSDTGFGMSADTLARATEAFFSSKGYGAGTGLGLFSVQSFLRETRGFLDLASTPGKGTSVSFYLPRSTAQGNRHPESPHEVPRGGGELVLVVETETRLREAICEQLETLGYRTRSAGGVAQAQALLPPGTTIRLVLVGSGTPAGQGGPDLARWVGAERPRVRVLLISGHRPIPSADATDQGADRAATVPAWLPKPYGIAALARAVRGALS